MAEFDYESATKLDNEKRRRHQRRKSTLLSWMKSNDILKFICKLILFPSECYDGIIEIIIKVFV
jgi:hypothetical protein